MKKLICLIIASLMFTSCSAQKEKLAYCFTMVFEKSNNVPRVTLYCKTPDSAGSDKMKDVSLDFNGESFTEAVKKIQKSNYEIYTNSILAYYLSTGLTQDEITEIGVLLLDNTGFKTDNLIYANDNESETYILHNKAKAICSDESIGKRDKKEYTPFIKQLRNLTDSRQKENGE